MRRRHLKALSSDEFPTDGFRRSGTIGLPDCTNEAAFTRHSEQAAIVLLSVVYVSN